MDRTILMNDGWCFYEGKKKPSRHKGLFARNAVFPMCIPDAFTLRKRLTCPKQVNDTVTVFFDGEYYGAEVFAGKNKIPPKKNYEGKTVYDITPALKTGVTVITATFKKGTVKGFFLSVKRNYDE